MKEKKQIPLTEQMIEEYLVKIFNKQEDKTIAYTGCKTKRLIEVSEFCSNPDCKNCQERAKAYSQAMKDISENVD